MANQPKAPQVHRDEPDRRERILIEAVRLFGEYGYDGTSIRDVAGAAGVNSALIYYYYTDKEGLFRQAVQRNGDRVRILIQTAFARPGTMREKLENFVLLWLREIHEDPASSGVMRRALESNSPVGDQLRKGMAENFGKMIALMAQGQKTGEIRPDLTEAELAAAGQLLLAGVVGLVTGVPMTMPGGSEGAFKPKTREQQALGLVGIWFEGMSPRV